MCKIWTNAWKEGNMQEISKESESESEEEQYGTTFQEKVQSG